MDTIITSIAFWIVCGIVAMFIANARGGDVVIAFFLGLFFGPLSIVLAFFLGGKDALDQRLVADGKRKLCPICSETIRPDALVCAHCGHHFVSLKPEETMTSAVEQLEKLAAMLDKGLLTREEFDAQKVKLLN